MQKRHRFHSIVAAILAAVVLICFGWIHWSEAPSPVATAPVAGPSRAMASPAARVEIRAPIVEEAAPAVAAVAVEPLPVEPALAMRQDVRWRAPMPEPTFAKFREWTAQYAAAKSPQQQQRLLAEGIALADERRAELADLIDKNPQRALELALPVAVRRALPAEVAARVEERVDGRGDLWVAAAVPMPGKELRVRPVERTVVMKDGRQFDAFTFGQRVFVPTRADIAIHGIALDGKLALSDLPGRVLEPEEVAATGGGICPASGLAANALGGETVVDFGEAKPVFFCGPSHALDAMIAASGDETFRTAEGIVAQSGYTEGSKKLLIIRVDFPDAPGQVVSDATLTSLIDNMSTQWDSMSYGKLLWFTFGNGSTFTPTLRLPNGHASYTGFGTMLSAARAAAADAGYNYQDYQFDVVVTGDKPDVGFGGIAYVGGRGAWLANSQWNLGVCSHEVGHNFGLNHAGFWDTTDGSPIGAGSAVEYGNPFDHMGGASSSTSAHFGARQKNYLDWLPDADVQKITANGTTTTRISAFDKKAATGKRAIAVDRSGTGNDYWIEYRQNYAGGNGYMLDGVLLSWGDVNINNGKPLLLDNTPGTSDLNDCTVQTGRTFSDTAAGIHITPILRGTTGGVTWIDVTVNRGPFTGNQKPTVSVGASNVNPAINGSVGFTATASDPDSDPLAYFWEWGDGTYTANNSTTASHAWTTTGTKTVRCRVTDLKGQTATGQLLIQVGTSTTFFIQGTVTGTATGPVENATVSAGSASDVTDSEGYYAITGLAAGSYTLTAVKTGLTINPANFTNPVAVGPSKANINFNAPPGAPIFGTMTAGLVDQGSNTGDVILPVSDPDTAVTALTLTGASSNVAIIPNASITFGTVGTTVRTVTVATAANVSGTVNITITATDPQGASASYVWPVTVNAKPVLSTATATIAENTTLDLDLRTLVTDDLTPADRLRFDVARVRDGSLAILADGHTARFTPSPDYHGAASFLLTARDQSLSSRTLFLYDFELPDTTADGKITDQSNFNRIASFEIAGTGGEYSYTADAPAALVQYGTQSVSLSEAGTGAARFRRTLATTDLNCNDEDWSLLFWAKRASNDTEDIAWHIGAGSGGSTVHLRLYFPAGSDTPKLAKVGAGGIEHELAGPALAVGTWHHFGVIYDRTTTNTGTLSLYVDGFLHGSVAAVAMDISQTYPMYFGGAQDNTAGLDRWFDGKFDDVLLQSGVSGAAEIWNLAHMGARHYLGLAVSGTVNVTVTGANQPPAISALADAGLFPGTVSPAIPFTLSDAESEARTVTVSASSSNTTLLPAGGIAIGAVPAAWSSGDLGTVSAAGSLTEDHGTFIVAGSGADIGGAGDEFRWVRQDLTGDGEIVARVAAMDFTNADAKAGVMMRDASSATAAHAFAYVTPGSGVAFQTRATNGATAATIATVNGVAAPCWVRVVRTGGSFSAYYATDTNGTAGAWQQIGAAQAVTFATAAPNRTGLAVTSKADGTLCTAVFDHLGGTVKLGGERTVTLTPAAGQQGTATVTLTANDGAATATRAFLLTVSPNSAPAISPVGDITSTEGVAIPSFTVTLSDVHSAPETLTLTAISSNPLLLPGSRIVITGTGATRTITLTPVASESGTATVTLTANDGSLDGTRTFTITLGTGDPSFFVRTAANWRYLDTGANPAGWQTTAFNDSAWAVGPAQLGFGEGDESTPVNSTASRITTYFRHSFQCADPAAWTHLRLRFLRDDGLVLYLNGSEIYRNNMPAGAIAATTQASVAISNADENVFLEVTLIAPPLVAGTNVFAVSLHQRGTTSSDLSFDMQAQGVGPSPALPVPAGSDWHYLDDGTDPGATWMTSAFAETAIWKTGPAQLGYGDGDEATAVASGPAGAHYITTYFRKKFLIANPADFAFTALRLMRDDGAVVYLNGVELLRDNMPAGAITGITPAASSIGSALEGVWQTFPFSPSLLVAGENVLAVEVHQFDVTSSDISFDLQLLAHAPNSIPKPRQTVSGPNLILTWPAWAATWQLKSTPDLQTWTAETATPAINGEGQMQVTLPLTPPSKFFRLEAP